MEKILTQEEARIVVGSLTAPGAKPQVLNMLRAVCTTHYLDPEVRISTSGRIRVHILLPMNPEDEDPYLRDCYSLREKFLDIEGFKRAYGIK